MNMIQNLSLEFAIKWSDYIWSRAFMSTDGLQVFFDGNLAGFLSQYFADMHRPMGFT